MPYRVANVLKYVSYAPVLAIPIALACPYARYGGGPYTVPKYLSFVPSRREPWLVNLANWSTELRFSTKLSVQRKFLPPLNEIVWV